MSHAGPRPVSAATVNPRLPAEGPRIKTAPSSSAMKALSPRSGSQYQAPNRAPMLPPWKPRFNEYPAAKAHAGELEDRATNRCGAFGDAGASDPAPGSGGGEASGGGGLSPAPELLTPSTGGGESAPAPAPGLPPSPVSGAGFSGAGLHGRQEAHPCEKGAGEPHRAASCRNACPEAWGDAPIPQLDSPTGGRAGGRGLRRDWTGTGARDRCHTPDTGAPTLREPQRTSRGDPPRAQEWEARG